MINIEIKTMPINEAELLDAKQILMEDLDLQEGMTYADLGIGTAAHFIFQAARIVGDTGRAYALDIIKPVLEATSSRAKSDGLLQIKTIWTDLEVYGAAKEVVNDSVDRMSIINLLFQTKKDEHVFNEANRMLKPGGKCMVIDWQPELSGFGPPQESRTSLDKVRKMANVVKWKEIKEFNVSKFHFGILFEK